MALRYLWVVGIWILAGLPRPAAGQSVQHPGTEWAFVGGELESYLRALQLTRQSPAHQWTIRGFSMVEMDRLAPTDSLHPWARRYPYPSGESPHYGVIAPRVGITYNSGFPMPSEGPVWTGRGFTSSAMVGAYGRFGPLSVTFAPILFRAENQAFGLANGHLEAPERYQDPRYPGAVDRPERFGDGHYTRLDAGETTARLDAYSLTLGLSTAGQQWGPMVSYPLMLGTNAGGFPHLFAGTATPVNVWIGRVHVRWIGGRLEQSAYSPRVADPAARLATGLTVTFSPRFAPELEIGASRFFHHEWPSGGFFGSDLLTPFEGLFKEGLYFDRGEEDELNQLAGVFGRWVFPASGFEVYGEFLREDHAWDLRHFLLEPGDISGYALGAGRVWSHSGQRFTRLVLEVLNSENSRRGRGSNPGDAYWPLYIHGELNQGHTHRGQILAADEAYGGAGLKVKLDRYHTGGRVGLIVERSQRMARRRFDLVDTDPAVDMQYSVGVDGLFFRDWIDVGVGLRAVYEMNRYFREDAFNLNATVGLRAALP